MFHIAKNGIITLTRGDTFQLPLFINLGTPLSPIQFELKEGDVVTFRVMRANEKSEDATIKKVFTKDDIDEKGNVIVRFEQSDTIALEPDTYYYEVKLNFVREEQENVNTIVERTKFYLIN